MFGGLNVNPAAPATGPTPTGTPVSSTTGPTPTPTSTTPNANANNPFSGLGINPDVLNQFMSTMVSRSSKSVHSK